MRLERLLIDLKDLQLKKHRKQHKRVLTADEIAFVEEALKRVAGTHSGKSLSAHQRAIVLSAYYSATYVYFIVSEEARVVKIGKSRRPESRLTDMKTGSPTKLRLLFSFLANEQTEGEIHRYLADHRSHGEWFHLRGPVLGLMEIAAEHGYRGVRAMLDFDESSLDAPEVTG